MYAQQCEASDVWTGIEIRDQRLQRMVRVVRRRRDRLEQRLEQRPQVRRETLDGRACLSGAGVRIDDRELDLRLVRARSRKSS